METATIKFVDAFRFRRMNDTDKIKVNTATTFAEQRLDRVDQLAEGDFGLSDMEEDKKE
jgi:hypothetical protein